MSILAFRVTPSRALPALLLGAAIAVGMLPAVAFQPAVETEPSEPLTVP